MSRVDPGIPGGTPLQHKSSRNLMLIIIDGHIPMVSLMGQSSVILLGAQSRSFAFLFVGLTCSTLWKKVLMRYFSLMRNMSRCCSSASAGSKQREGNLLRTCYRQIFWDCLSTGRDQPSGLPYVLDWLAWLDAG
ncbi:hypothetical protein 1 [Sanxia tombus-like virus 2]|uniref:hypothetical protein 1 n=1 Tax=Sanxia tombus-like virus 2 TaxID=1923386 RepID=UPI000909DF8C|nr:hypothetical protein 1 [Sanxia tombus-like virus 2]APG76447.1 hypothetical protein 1 [Sanxia tombus-like virus 2]